MTDQLRQRPGDQPLPEPADGPVMHDLVRADLQARLELGISRYGQPLRAFNGRDPLRDAYEEILDLSVYLKQSMIERDDAVAQALIQVHVRCTDLFAEILRQLPALRRDPEQHAVELAALEGLLPGMDRVMGFITDAIPDAVSPATQAMRTDFVAEPNWPSLDRLNVEGEAWVKEATTRWQDAEHDGARDRKPYLGELIRWLMEREQRATELQAALVELAPAVDENTSDGHHTFKELYDYRLLYNAALFNEWAARGAYGVHKARRHSDGELCFGGGWFIVVAQLPTGQISNHYPDEAWDLFRIPGRERGAVWDGHTPAVAAERLRAVLAAGTSS